MPSETDGSQYPSKSSATAHTYQEWQNLVPPPRALAQSRPSVERSATFADPRTRRERRSFAAFVGILCSGYL